MRHRLNSSCGRGARGLRGAGDDRSCGRRGRCHGQAAAEYLLVTTLVVLAIVAAPDNSIERLVVAVETRYQSLARFLVTP